MLVGSPGANAAYTYRTEDLHDATVSYAAPSISGIATADGTAITMLPTIGGTTMVVAGANFGAADDLGRRERPARLLPPHGRRRAARRAAAARAARRRRADERAAARRAELRAEPRAAAAVGAPERAADAVSYTHLTLPTKA